VIELLRHQCSTAGPQLLPLGSRCHSQGSPGPHSYAAVSVRWSGEEPGQLGMILEPR
jgi:predicted CxxxxCH...CXXCH cytochrome family protein